MNNNKPSRRLMAIALSIVMVLGLMPVSAAAETLPPDYSWYDANTAAHRFEIGSPAQLKGLADIVNGNHGAAFAFTGREVSLTADIDLSGYDNWTPIGANYNTFSGTFTGNSHTISGLTINEPAQSGVGLFGLMLGSVSDLYLSNVNITGYQNVGGIAGEVWGSISHCAVDGRHGFRLRKHRRHRGKGKLYRKPADKLLCNVRYPRVWLFSLQCRRCGGQS
jgi:hypothetical protein